jgi:hypothetical protein
MMLKAALRRDLTVATTQSSHTDMNLGLSLSHKNGSRHDTIQQISFGGKSTLLGHASIAKSSSKKTSVRRETRKMDNSSLVTGVRPVNWDLL